MIEIREGEIGVSEVENEIGHTPGMYHFNLSYNLKVGA